MTIDILSAFDGEFQMSTGKIMITGATGDTGGHAIERLLELGRESVRWRTPGRAIGEALRRDASRGLRMISFPVQ